MSDIVTFQPATDLMRFAEEASQVHGIAKALATTNFVPATMQGKPDEITAAILFGRELGLDPMTALQTVHVIERRPALAANAMRGLAVAAGCKFRLDDSNDTRVIMSARAPGDEDWTTVTWNIDRADKMGLIGKSNWKKMPQAMLVARATSELCRLVASNVLIGLPYSVEEMQDVGDGDNTIQAHAAKPQPKQRPVKRAYAEPANDHPELEQAPPDYKPVQQVKEIGYDTRDLTPAELAPRPERTDTVDIKVRTAIMARFNDMNLRARNDRLAKITEIVGREIFSVNMLTAAEGRQVLEAISPEQDWPDVEVTE